MGSFGTSKTTQQQVNTPWAKQTPFLQQGFTEAQKALGQAQSAPKPTDFVSQFSPESLNLFQKMIGSADGTSGQQTSQIGTQVGGAGANALTDAFSKLSGWTPQGDASTNIAAAQQYANNPAVSGMVDSAMRGAERSAFENYLPAVNRNAAATGNLNSSKTALREGVVARGLAEKRADIDSNIRGSLFNDGLKLAENARQFDSDSVLKSILGNLSGGTSAVSAGANAAGAGTDVMKSLFDIAKTGVEGQVSAGQAGLDDDMARWQFGTNSPFGALKNFWEIVGSNSWGGTSTGSGTQSASPAAVIGGLLGAAGSFGRGFSGSGK